MTLTATPDRFTFSFARREAMIDTAARVARNGRIVGFGEGDRGDGAQVVRLFGAGGNRVDERVMQAVCRRGLEQVLGPLALRPRVVVRGASRLGVSREAFTRVLRAAGAAAVEFSD